MTSEEISTAISTGVLEMKFMQRTKNRLDEEQKRKKDEALKRAFLGGDSSAESSASDVKRSKNEQSNSDLTAPPEVIFEQRYEVLEDLCFGRISFGGFNPEVEKLMQYYKDLKEGIKPTSEDILGEIDISDKEMALALGGGNASESLRKKFKRFDARRQQQQKNDEERHGKVLITETCEETGSRRRGRNNNGDRSFKNRNSNACNDDGERNQTR